MKFIMEKMHEKIYSRYPASPCQCLATQLLGGAIVFHVGLNIEMGKVGEGSKNNWDQ